MNIYNKRERERERESKKTVNSTLSNIPSWVEWRHGVTVS